MLGRLKRRIRSQIDGRLALDLGGLDLGLTIEEIIADLDSPAGSPARRPTATRRDEHAPLLDRAA